MFDEPVLIVSPHADDEVFGCGGFLSKYRPNMHMLLVAASDIEHRDGTCSTAEQRRVEFKTVADALGATCSFGNLADTRLPLLKDKIIVLVEDLADAFKPKTILFTDRSFHQDHAAVYEACFAACRPARAPSVKTVVTFEVPNYVWFDRTTFFEPSLYLALSLEQLDKKLALVDLHTSQTGRETSPIDRREVVDHARYRGHEVGVGYAEAFRVHRKVVSI